MGNNVKVNAMINIVLLSFIVGINGDPTTCQKELATSTTANVTYVVGAFIPRCNPDGTYSQRQCHGSTGHCWCVETNYGKEIIGTRKGPGEGQVICEVSTTSSSTTTPSLVTEKKEPKRETRCSDLICKSVFLRYTICRVPRGRSITTLLLTRKLSRRSCTWPRRMFGILWNRIWVNKGCIGKFKYCYTQAVTTASSPLGTTTTTPLGTTTTMSAQSSSGTTDTFTDSQSTHYTDEYETTLSPQYTDEYETTTLYTTNLPVVGNKSSCNLPSAPGMCRAYIASWYFDTKTKTCRKFIWGGCGGNGNRFPTEKLCKTSCAPEEKPTCAYLTCSSRSGKKTTCRPPKGRIITKVTLKKQISRTSCKKPRIRFGVRRNRIWVHQGCRGTFRYCYQAATKIPATPVPEVRRCANIPCKSRDGKYTTCRIPKGRIVTKVSMKKQVSRTNCIRPKVKFGTRGNRIWVTDGCHGTFTYCYKKVNKPVPRGGVNKPVPHKYPGGEKCTRLSCSSRNGKHTLCRVPRHRVIANLTLDKQTSRKSCQRPKKNFGVKNNKIWVDKGCNGKFTYCYATGEAEMFAEIACTSFHNSYKTCAVPPGRIITELTLKRKVSRHKCDNFGIRHDNKIWVNNGCGGVFKYGYATERACADISCSSWGFQYAECNIPRDRVITKVLLKKQTSKTHCREPRIKFGVRNNKIWVDKGCRGIFTYCYVSRKSKGYGMVNCGSTQYRYNACAVPRGHRITQVSLERQISKTSCGKTDNNFGIRLGKEIWVQKGCRGVFRYSYAIERCAEISCTSRTNSYTTSCAIQPNRVITRVSIKNGTQCNGRKNVFGARDNKIWVRQGCSGVFTYCYIGKKTTRRFSEVNCASMGHNYKVCKIPTGRKIIQLSLKREVARTNCRKSEEKFGIRFRDNKIWVNKDCHGVFKYRYITDTLPPFPTRSIVAYWGQNAAGRKGLLPEKNLKHYCDNFDYDVIPISFLTDFFSVNNKDHLPGLDLSHHCSKTFNGYPDLLKCYSIGREIKACQRRGKQITLSLGGPTARRRFQNAKEARTFARTIWDLFLGGRSNLRPFGRVVLDGIDMDIKGGNNLFYADFVKHIRKLMTADRKRKYIITVALKCILSDVVMGPRHGGNLLQDIPHEFDHLYVKFFSRHGLDGRKNEMSGIVNHWFKFAEETRKTYGKGPSIFVGLLANPQQQSGARYYTPPHEMRKIIHEFGWNNYFGGAMLWDASFDLNNNINGKYYSSYISDIIRPEPRIVMKHSRLRTRHWLSRFHFGKLLGWCVFILVILVILKMFYTKHISKNKVHVIEEKPKPSVDGPPTYDDVIPHLYPDPMPYSYNNQNLPPYEIEMTKVSN